jgi:hypothetical protein
MKLANVLGMILLLLPAMVLADFTLLDANFDDKTIDAPIGTGGAVLGEPIDISGPIASTVRDTPFFSNCLEIVKDEDLYSSGALRWGLIGDADVDIGHVWFGTNIWHDVLGDYTIRFNDVGGYSGTFANVYWRLDGSIRCSDSNGYVGVIGTAVQGTMQTLSIDFDMENDTYTVELDGSPVLVDRAHGVTDMGIGTVWLSMDHTSLLNTEFSIDNMLMTADEYTATDISTFSEVKSSY